MLPRSAWPELFGQASAAATFRENVYLATRGMAYGAAGDGASPFQHFWSLSVQAQFFLLWPLVAVGLLWMMRSRGCDWTSTAFMMLAGVMSVVSFAYAIYMVNADQPVAYYSLGARLWEFGLGALAYFWGRRAARYPGAGGLLGWVGVILIFSSGFIVNGRDLFPGPWTLWPVIGTLLILFSADSGGAAKSGLTRAMSIPLVKWLASLGYILYLWHWPILVLYPAHTGSPYVGWRGAVGVLVLSMVLSGSSQKGL